jgi:hypothetical protein
MASLSLKRIAALLLLPLSIVPVGLLGPSVLRAPITLLHEFEGDVVRLNPFAVASAQAAEEPGPLSAALAPLLARTKDPEGVPA